MRASISFRSINPDLDGELVRAFARDLFLCSFGDGERFDQEYGADGQSYVTWLVKVPKQAVFACEGTTPIGMVVLGTYEHNPAIGYVYTYYLIEQARGRSLGDDLDTYACRTLAESGFRLARLSVSLSNAPALRFYQRRGWYDAGPRPQHPEVHYFEKHLSAAE